MTMCNIIINIIIINDYASNILLIEILCVWKLCGIIIMTVMKASNGQCVCVYSCVITM